MPNAENSLKELKAQVFAKRPVLKEIAEKYSNLSLAEYVKFNWEIPAARPDAEFLAAVKEQASLLYGGKQAKALISQLESKPLVSTIEHLGIWNHPIFLNSGLIYSLHFKAAEIMPIFATESVSLNNDSSWSGCLLEHAGGLKRYSFFPDRLKTLPVFSTPAIKSSYLSRFKLKTKNRFNGLLDSLQIAQAEENFSSQACKVSGKFWQMVFPAGPKAVFLPLETVVINYLLKVLQQPENIFSLLILTAKGQGLWQKYFSGEHTFMFWGIDAKGRRRVLAKLPQTKHEISSLLRSRKIYPSSPLCFMVLLSAGLACAGGFTQTSWLTEVKQKFTNLLKDLGQNQNIGFVPTKNFAESSLAWLKISNYYVAPTALDLYLTGRDYYANFMGLAQKLSLGQSLDLAMPTIYSVVVPKAGQPQSFNIDAMRRQIFKNFHTQKLLEEIGI